METPKVPYYPQSFGEFNSTVVRLVDEIINMEYLTVAQLVAEMIADLICRHNP